VGGGRRGPRGSDSRGGDSRRGGVKRHWRIEWHAQLHRSEMVFGRRFASQEVVRNAEGVEGKRPVAVTQKNKVKGAQCILTELCGL